MTEPESKKLMYLKQGGSKWKVFAWDYELGKQFLICERLPRKKPALIIGVPRSFLKEIK